jgi:hypothetical protein
MSNASLENILEKNPADRRSGSDGTQVACNFLLKSDLMRGGSASGCTGGGEQLSWTACTMVYHIAQTGNDEDSIDRNDQDSTLAVMQPQLTCLQPK